MEVRELDGITYYRGSGKRWYKSPQCRGLTAYDLMPCDACGREFFGVVYSKNRLGKPAKRRFCSRQCFASGWGTEGNPGWNGEQVKYRGAHLRVARMKGKAASCTVPGCVAQFREGACFHWASLTGNWADVDDYVEMCVFHHRALDWAKILGMGNEEALERIANIAPEFQHQDSRQRIAERDNGLVRG